MASKVITAAPAAAGPGTHWFRPPAPKTPSANADQQAAADETHVHNQLQRMTTIDDQRAGLQQKRYEQKRKMEAALWWATMTAEKQTDKAVRGGTAYSDFVDILRISDNPDGGPPIPPWPPNPGVSQEQGRASRRRIMAH